MREECVSNFYFFYVHECCHRLHIVFGSKYLTLSPSCALQPIGVIGDPLGFGLNYYAIGVRKDIPPQTVRTMNYWMNRLMTCSPTEECPHESFAMLYPRNGGTGEECGYIQFPVSQDGLSGRVVAGTVVGVVGFVAAVCFLMYYYYLRRQKHRYKKQFVKQIAKNINIGPSPKCIPIDILADQVQHIGNKDGVISKVELSTWMRQNNLEFLSNRDFDALWAAMDVDNKGAVNAIDFFVFLSACGSEFEQVFNEQHGLTKKERLEAAARRLSKLNRRLMGETRVVNMNNKRITDVSRTSVGNSTDDGSEEGNV